MSSVYADHSTNDDGSNTKMNSNTKNGRSPDFKPGRSTPINSGRGAEARRAFDSSSRRLESSRSLEAPRSGLGSVPDSTKGSLSPVATLPEAKASPSKSTGASKLLRKSSLGKSRTIRWLKQKYPSFESNGW